MRDSRCRFGRFAFAAAAALLAGGTGAAKADDFVQGTRSPKLVEKAHAIEILMDRGHATLVVRRTVHNGGPRHDQAVFRIELPPGAVATGLRTLGMKDGQPFWFKGDLMEAVAAANKYQELTGIGGYHPKDPALLSWRGQTTLMLQVFPVAPSEPKTVEYSLKIPTSYEVGRDRLTLPSVGTMELPAEAVVSPARAEDTLLIDHVHVATGARIKLDKERTIEIERGPSPPVLDGAFAMVPFAKERALVRYHVEAAARLSEVPPSAHVVVLLDASRSWTADQAESARAAARAYLAHFKDAKVEIMTFDRRVRAIMGGFAPVDRAALELERLVLKRGNGSALDEALALADAKLARAPASSARRILALTDLRTRSQLVPERARGRLGKSGALVHIGVVEKGGPSLSRDDDSPWAKLVRPTGGLVWRAHASLEREDRQAMRVTYEELARPLRIDHVKVSVPGVTLDEHFFPSVLDEGQGIEDLRIEKKQVPWVEVTGELWSRPVRRVLMPDDAEGRLWSALVFGSHLFDQLTEEEMMPLALRGQAVTPVTSYLAIEPGVRPSTEGLDFGETFGLGGLGLSGVGEGGGGSGMGFGSSGRNAAGFLHRELEQAYRACGGTTRADRPLPVKIETTLREIVDVRVGRSGPSSAAERCLEEAAWAIDLPAMFFLDVEDFVIEI